MQNTDRDLDRCLTLLRNLIRQRGFTQMEVQDALGWGRSYISQLLTKKKALRFEQILMPLGMRLSSGRPTFEQRQQLLNVAEVP